MTSADKVEMESEPYTCSTVQHAAYGIVQLSHDAKSGLGRQSNGLWRQALPVHTGVLHASK